MPVYIVVVRRAVLPNTEIFEQNYFNKKIPKLNISIQNVCSLNISKPGPKLHSKLIAITKSESEVIFICDTRLNSNVQTVGINDIKKNLISLGTHYFIIPPKAAGGQLF